MARPKALAAALAIAAAPAAVRAEPLDLSLARLGAPTAAVWLTLADRQTVALDAATAAQLAGEARARFATLSVETALAFSAALLQPASTTGVAGWDVAFEVSYVGVHPGTLGTAVYGSTFGPRGPWQTKGLVPNELFLTGLHVRKALPYSLELGGRAVYLSQSNYGAAQLEGKWALLEGFEAWPDLALRGAYTAVLGQRDWNLGALEADLLASKRFGLNAVASVTPYLGVRWSRVKASSETLDFGPTTGAGATPAELAATQAAFPELTTSALRYTLGARLAASTLTVAVEGTFFPGSTISADDYKDVEISGSWGVGGRVGWEF